MDGMASEELQPFVGAGKQFKVKFVGFECIDRKKGEDSKTIARALESLRVAMLHLKSHKPKTVIGLNLHCLTMVDERSKAIKRFPLDKVFYVGHSPTDACYIGIMVAAKDSETGYKLLAFKAEQKVASSIVSSANELFTLAFHMRKKQRSRSCGDQGSIMTREERRQKAIDEWKKLDAKIDDTKKQLDLSPAVHKPRPGETLAAPAENVSASTSPRKPLPVVPMEPSIFDVNSLGAVFLGSPAQMPDSPTFNAYRKMEKKRSASMGFTGSLFSSNQAPGQFPKSPSADLSALRARIPERPSDPPPLPPPPFVKKAGSKTLPLIHSSDGIKSYSHLTSISESSPSPTDDDILPGVFPNKAEEHQISGRGSDAVFNLDTPSVASSLSLLETQVVSSHDLFDQSSDVFETPMETNGIELARQDQTSFVHPKSHSLDGHQRAPSFNSPQVKPVQNSVGDGLPVVQAIPSPGDVMYENISSWHSLPTTEGPASFLAQDSPVVPSLETGTSSAAFSPSTNTISETRTDTSHLPTPDAFAPLKTEACPQETSDTNSIATGFDDTFDNHFLAAGSSTAGVSTSPRKSNIATSAGDSPSANGGNQNGILTQHQPVALPNDPWESTLPAANGDGTGSARAEMMKSDSQDEDDLFYFDPLKFRPSFGSSAPKVSDIEPSKAMAAFQELSDVFQHVPGSAQTAANQTQDVDSKMPVAHEEQVGTAPELLYENTDDVFPEIKDRGVWEKEPSPSKPRRPIPTPRKGVEKPLDAKEAEHLTSDQLTAKEGISPSIRRERPVPPLRSRPLPANSEQSSLSGQQLPSLILPLSPPNGHHSTLPENDFDVSSFSLPPVPDILDNFQVDPFSAPESQANVGQQDAALYYEPPPPPLPPPLPPKDPWSQPAQSSDNDDADAYDDILAPGGLNNKPAPSSVGDDLGDYVPHEPQVTSSDLEDYEDMTSMHKQSKEELENETYSTIVPLTSPSVQEPTTTALGSENTQPPLPAVPTSDARSPTPAPQSSPSTDTTTDVANKPPSSDKKGPTKEEAKMLQKVEENRLKELKKQEKEQKKREELKMKNKMKSMKSLKIFKLTEDMKPLFSVEVVEGRSKSKDHLAVVKGEQLSVFVTSHPKLPQGKLLVEKGDGTFGFVDEAITKQEQTGLPPPPASGDIVEDDIYEKLDAPDLATISRPPPALPLPNPTLHEGTGGVTDVANRPPPLPPPNSSLHHEGTGMPDSSSLPPALPLRHSTPNDVVEVYDIAGGPPAPQPHSSTTYKDGVEVYDPTNVPPALPPRNITPQPDASTQANALDDVYDDIIPAKLSVSGEVRHGARSTDPPILLPESELLPPESELPPPTLPPKTTQTPTQADSDAQEAFTLTENREELFDQVLPLPPKPSEIDSSVQEFDVSLFTDFDESLPLPDLSVADMSAEELPDLSLLSPPPESFLELPCLPDNLDLPALGIIGGEEEEPAIFLPEATDSTHQERSASQEPCLPHGSDDASELPAAAIMAPLVADYLEPKPSLRPSLDEYSEVRPRDEKFDVRPQAQNPSVQSVDTSSLDNGAPAEVESGPTTKSMTKEEKKRLQKEEEKRQKELRKQELMREKEMKRKLEQKRKNRMKSQKGLKQFNLPEESPALFTVEVIEARSKGKEHLPVTKGERLAVIVSTHAKLPTSKYLVEKEDGTLGFVDAVIVTKVATEGETNSSDTASQERIQDSTAATLEVDKEGIYEEVRVPDGTLPPPTSSASNMAQDSPLHPHSHSSTQNIPQLPSSDPPPLPPPVGSQSGESSGTS